MKKGVFIVFLFLILFLAGAVYASFVFQDKNVLKVTEEHPFLLNGKWIPASDLKTGDELFSVDGKKVRITGIRDVNESVEVYNLEVKNYSNFVVNGVVVHNSNKVIEVPIISEITRAKFADGLEISASLVNGLDDEGRIAYAESRLGELSDSKREAILYARNNLDDIGDKTRYLSDHGFGELEREILLSEGVCDFTYGVTITTPGFIDSNLGYKIPIPSEEDIPVFDRHRFLNQFGDITDPVQGEALLKVADNLEYVNFKTFKKELDDSVRKFNDYIGDEPYVVVLRKDGKSHPWVYDLASETLKNKPVDVVFIKRDEALFKYFEQGIKKFVIFDDATYTGTQLTTNEFGGKILSEFQDWVPGDIGRNTPDSIEYIAVTSAYTEKAAKGFAKLNSIYSHGNSNSIKSTLISSRKMETLENILTEEQLLELQHFGIEPTGEQTLTYFAHKVPDLISFPDSVYVAMSFKNGKQYAFGSEPYKKTETDFYKRWLEAYLQNLILVFKFFLVEI